MTSHTEELRATAQAMVTPGKGILAMDESNTTCNKRFEKLGIPITEERRRAYRELILTTPQLSDFISASRRRLDCPLRKSCRMRV
jgi:fructose-bisphosphate aldolase, class I